MVTKIKGFFEMFTWAWIIIVGGLMITPGGVSCIVCGIALDVPGYIGKDAVTFLGIGSMVIGFVGFTFSMMTAMQSKAIENT
ncbi:MAG: hypothetical protein RLN82_02330 [Pseudomonadales bacterium]